MTEEDRAQYEVELRECAFSILRDKSEIDAEESGCAPLIEEVIAIEHASVSEADDDGMVEIIEAIVKCDDGVRRRIIYTAASDDTGNYTEDELDWVDELD